MPNDNLNSTTPAPTVPNNSVPTFGDSDNTPPTFSSSTATPVTPTITNETQADPIVANGNFPQTPILNPIPTDTSFQSTPPQITGDNGNSNAGFGSVTTSAHVPQKYGGKKVIATIFSVLLLVGAVAAGVKLAGSTQLFNQDANVDSGKIAIFKYVCNNIGQQDVCNNRDTSLGDYKVDYKVHSGNNDQGPVVQTITVTISDNDNGQGDTGNASQGRKSGDSLAKGTYTACEIPIAYNSTGNRISLDVEPRPNASEGGSSGGTNQKQYGSNCITVDLNGGEAELKYLNKRQASASLSPTPPGKICDVAFELPDTAVCWLDPKANVPIKYTVKSLPPTGGPYYMQTDWYVASPTAGSHHYKDTQLITAGQTYTLNADWPGVPVGETRTVEIHAGINVVNSNKQILSPACSGGMDYYWTKYVCSSNPTISPNISVSPVLSPTLPPNITAKCLDVKTYNAEKKLLTLSDLSKLKTGDKVTFAVAGQTSSGTFTKARFTVNGVSLGESTTKNTNGEFYVEYTVPAGTTTFTVKGEINHSTLGWM